MLMAGFDGIQNRIEPHDPVDKDIYDLPPAELQGLPSVPGSLDEALEALRNDHEFLLQGGVFTQGLIDSWIAYKEEHEVDPVRLASPPVRVPPVLRHLASSIAAAIVNGGVGRQPGPFCVYPPAALWALPTSVSKSSAAWVKACAAARLKSPGSVD